MMKYRCVETGQNTNLVHIVSELQVIDDEVRIDCGLQLYVGGKFYDLIRPRAIDYDSLLRLEEQKEVGYTSLHGGYVISRHPVGQFSHLSLDNVLFFSSRTMQEVIPWTKTIYDQERVRRGRGELILRAGTDKPM